MGCVFFSFEVQSFRGIVGKSCSRRTAYSSGYFFCSSALHCKACVCFKRFRFSFCVSIQSQKMPIQRRRNPQHHKPSPWQKSRTPLRKLLLTERLHDTLRYKVFANSDWYSNFQSAPSSSEDHRPLSEKTLEAFFPGLSSDVPIRSNAARW